MGDRILGRHADLTVVEWSGEGVTEGSLAIDDQAGGLAVEDDLEIVISAVANPGF